MDIIHNNKIHTTDLAIGDLCFNPNTSPTKYYIVHDVLHINNEIYYMVSNTRFGRKFKVKRNILIKPHKEPATQT